MISILSGWVSFLVYLNLFGIKDFVVVVVVLSFGIKLSIAQFPRHLASRRKLNESELITLSDLDRLL
jgi:hypothetical protein